MIKLIFIELLPAQPDIKRHGKNVNATGLQAPPARRFLASLKKDAVSQLIAVIRPPENKRLPY